MIKNENYLIKEEFLVQEAALRKKDNIEKKIDRDDIAGFESEGWEVKKIYKNGSATVAKKKDIYDFVLDQLWMVFFKMDFKVLNVSPIVFSFTCNGEEQEKTVDLIAMDDETCLFVDCYAIEEKTNARTFGTEINSIKNSLGPLISDIRSKYGDKKFKYILVTYNYCLNDLDLKLLEQSNIIQFDEENISYYNSLVEHLGTAARYQLLGSIFSKATIKGMDSKIPAIEGRMGNLTYYSFLIEPERLLKIGYVLHKTKAHMDQMPTYQRLIKKDRLKKIREFVNNGGYFPNSLIVSIDTKDKLKFEKAPQNFQTEHATIGTLYLPREYKTAYIIDGQHRLYGYSESKFAEKDTIPVIAFVNLDKDNQLKMFMDINENQKPVSKTLRNILNIDLNWNSDNLSKRREAVILHICQELGEKADSPLFGRVLTGEDAITEKRCITIEYLKSALEKTCFFNKYNKKNEIIERGLLDKEDSEMTYKVVYAYLRNCLQVIADMCDDEWNKGSQGYLTINNTMVGVIRVIGDISYITYLNNAQFDDYNINNINIDSLYQDSQELLVDFADTIKNLPVEKRNDIKTAKGGAAKEIAWRTLQVALHDTNSTFTNKDLEKYIEENCTNYNDEGLNEILFIKEDIISTFKDKITSYIDWENLYFPEDLAIKLNQKVTAIKIKNNRAGIEQDVNIWNIAEFDDLCKIMNYKSNWSMMFKDYFNYTLEKSYTRVDIVNIIKTISNSESKINSGKQITKSEYEFVHDFYVYIKSRGVL